MDNLSTTCKVNSLQVILQKIYDHYHDNAMLITLLKFLADEINKLHQRNHLLGSISNKDLFIYYHEPQDWQTISLEKKEFPRLEQPLTLQQRALDIAQLDFPDDYWRIFKHMYFGDDEIPEVFNGIADKQRLQYRRHHANREINEQNIWLWDEKSAQAMVVLNSKSKQRYRKLKQYALLLWRVISALPILYFHYRRLMKSAYKKKFNLANRLGIALTVSYQTVELDLLQELGNIPVLLRFYCHEDKQQWQTTLDFLHLLSLRNIKVAVALVQDREAVINHKKWKMFLGEILPKIADHVLWIEVGHAINRVKWGIWKTAEYVDLLKFALAAKQRYPNLQFIAPAVIDFEWYRIIDILQALPRRLKLFAISQHLYVDRRGAPENHQGKFSTLEKCAMGKAIAQLSHKSADRFIISEFNWPLKDTGIWSPIGSPYTTPEWFRNRPGVSEETYANYLIRYLAITLCSGFVSQVFIWRLSAHGYGLVDDRDQFRKRPAFFALKNFLCLLGGSDFIERLPSAKEIYLLQFKNNDQLIILGWTTLLDKVHINLPDKPKQVIDRDGNCQEVQPADYIVTQTPCYYLLKK